MATIRLGRWQSKPERATPPGWGSGRHPRRPRWAGHPRRARRFGILAGSGALLLGWVLRARAAAPTPAPRVVFMAYADAAPVLAAFRDSDLPGSTVASAAAWDAWIRAHDAQVRGRIVPGVEDSITNLLLYGTSFTARPRLADWSAATDAHGAPSPPALARIADLLAALTARRAAPRDARLAFAGQFLRRQRPPRGGLASAATRAAWREYLTANLERFAAEQAAYQRRLAAAQATGSRQDIVLARSFLFEHRGLSVDTSLMPNYALVDTLRVLLAKGVLRRGAIHRIAVIGPGLDFADKREGYDFYPEQTLQPFAMLDGVVGLGLGQRSDVSLATLDINPQINAHIAGLAARAAAHRPYVLQLPLASDVPWTEAARSYWQTVGIQLGADVQPMPLPPHVHHVALRAVAIGANWERRITPVNLDIVAQTIASARPPGSAPGAGAAGFDLIVATNILVYYNPLEQALALANISRMLAPGGVFLANDALPAVRPAELQFLGRRGLPYSTDHQFGDDIVVYRKAN